MIADSVQFLGSRDGGGGNGNGFTATSDVPADTSDFEGARRGRRRQRRRHPLLGIPPRHPRDSAARLLGAVARMPWFGSPGHPPGELYVRTAQTWQGPETQHPSDAAAPADRMRPRKYTRINVEEIDYKDLNLLRRFISDKGKTRSRRVTGLSRKHQRQLAVAVKRAREIALLPYVGER